MSNIIFDSIKISFSQAWKNKKLMILLLMIQIVFLSSLIFVNMHYQPKILDSAMAISSYINSLQLDEASIAKDVLEQKNLLGEDPLFLGKQFEDMKYNFRMLLLLSFLLMVFFLGLNYSLTNGIQNKFHLKKNFLLFLKTSFIAFCYLGLVFLFFYSVFNIEMIDIDHGSRLVSKYVSFMIISVFLFYFMFISISIIQKVNFSDIIQRTLILGIKKWRYIATIFLINFLLIFSLFFLTAFFVERSPIIMAALTLFMLLYFVLGRLFMMNLLEKVDN